jgi:hypothetical protein
MRSREGRDVHIESGRLEIEPKATVRWLRDPDANSVAIITFSEPAATLRICSEVDVDLRDSSRLPNRPQCPRVSVSLPGERAIGIGPLPSAQLSTRRPPLQRWLRDLYQPAS